MLYTSAGARTDHSRTQRYILQHARARVCARVCVRLTCLSLHLLGAVVAAAAAAAAPVGIRRQCGPACLFAVLCTWLSAQMLDMSKAHSNYVRHVCALYGNGNVCSALNAHLFACVCVPAWCIHYTQPACISRRECEKEGEGALNAQQN